MSPKRYVYVPVPFVGNVPFTPFNLSLLGIVLVAGFALAIYMKFYRQPEVLLLNFEQANKQLIEANAEYGRHVFDEPTKHEMFEDADGRLALRVYADHCVLIQRTTRSGVRTKLVIDLAREVGRVSSLADALSVPLDASTLTPPPYLPFKAAQAGCDRGCLNLHPGSFTSWYGARDGCWVEVFRRFEDGCTHVQMFQYCAGYWDSNTDGSPKIRHICCIH